jgi:hypothetical protein
VKALAIARAEDLGRKAMALEEMPSTLLDLAARCNGDTRPDCPIIDSLDKPKRRRTSGSKSRRGAVRRRGPLPSPTH